MGFRRRGVLGTQRHSIQSLAAHSRCLGKQFLRGDEETYKIGRTLSSDCDGTKFVRQDTEFPGIIATRCEIDQRYYSEQECEYFLVKRNV